jgi:hypothetical protein
MGISLTGDARIYRQFVRFTPAGTVASVHLVDETQPIPSDGESNVYLDVSDLYPSNVSTPKVDPTLVQAVKTAQASVIGTDTSAVTAALANLKAAFVASKAISVQ